MNKWFVILVLILAAIFIAVIAKTQPPQTPENPCEYPCDFQKIADLVMAQGGPRGDVGDVIGLEVMGPGDQKANPNGRIFLMAGVGPKRVGCGIALLSEKGDAISAQFVYYVLEEDKFISLDLITDVEEEMTQEEACKFVTDWLREYYAMVGTDA